ncbi:MAG TPA: hypothetical protein VGF94_08740 [Kofleriaceae bacterium]|jgi:hypothetical protein
MRYVLLAAALLVACGGKQQTNDTQPTGPTVVGMGDSGDSTDRSGNMIPPDKMDEVQQDLGRRREMISRCLATAMDNREVKRGTHGKVTFEIVIGASGHTQSVRVDKTDIPDKGVIDCATKLVEDTAFPELPHKYETSYTYAMEAN